MEFRILGSLEVRDEGRVLPLRGGKQRAVLALLLLHANEVVPTDRLIDELWAGETPKNAATTLYGYVSQLRKALAPDGRKQVVVTRAPGYVVELEPDQLDARRFERLVTEARTAFRRGEPAQAAATLRESLALWRGPALADFVFESFAQAEILRLEELRFAALEDRVEADLALGRHADVLGELEALAIKHPLRERLHSLLMLALYRSGRQAEALAAYQAARRTLVEELGIEPGRALQELERSILRQDPSLDLAAPPEAARTPKKDEQPELRAAGVFVGREQELEALLTGLAAALAGRGQLFLISGEPGIGKSRLADELAYQAGERGAQVLVGRCWEAGGAPAYWPWVQAIRTYLRERDAETLRSQAGSGAPELAHIVPELRALVDDLPAAPSLEPEGARFRLFDAATTFLRNAAAAQPLVLVLDDLHAADAPSLLLLQFVAGELADSRLLVVGAYRDVDPALEEPLASTLAELARGQATRLALTGLAEADVARFIELTAGAGPAASLVAAIHAETEGNPLFVGEVVRLLASEGRLADGGRDSLTLMIPQGVRAVISRRLRHLSEKCKDILVLASALGREFSLDALERLGELSGEELLEVLDEAVAARVVTEMPAAPRRLRFAHALIRDTLYEEVTGARRLRLHRRIAEVLEELYSEEPEPHLAELAHHFFAAVPGGDVDKAIDYARRAGDRAATLLAYEEALRLYESALQALELKHGTDEPTRCEVLLTLGDAQARAGEEPAAKETFLRAAQVARRLRASDRLARAALGYGGRFVWARAGTDEYLVPLLEEALVGLGDADSRLRVRVLARLAGALRDEHARGPGAALSQEAVEMARRIGEPATLAYALDGRCMAIFWPENPEERIAIATELVRLAEEAGDRERAAQGRYYRLMFLLELGAVPTVKGELERVAVLMGELKQPAQAWLVEATRATLALFEGRFEEGEQLLSDALSLGERAQSSDAVLSYRIQLFTLRRERGELEELEEILERSIESYPARPMFRCMLALLYADLGREQDARRAFEELASDDFGVLPRRNEWLFSLGFLSDVAFYLGDVERAQTLYELLSPYADRNASTADYISTGSVSRPLGVLATAMSRWEEAERHFEEALELNRAMGALPWVAHTQHDFARMLLARGAPGDRERALELVESCLATCRESGMKSCAESASALEPSLKEQRSPTP